MVTLELLLNIVYGQRSAFWTVCQVPSSPLELSYVLVTTDVSVHLYPNIQGGGVSDLSRTQLPLQEKPFPPKGNTKTGQTSITITLIKRETKAQHSSRQWTTLQSQNRFKSKLERYSQSCYWTPSAKDKAAQTNRSLALVSS